MDSRSVRAPGTRSSGDYWGNIDNKGVEELTLKVYGTTSVGKLKIYWNSVYLLINYFNLSVNFHRYRN